MEATAIKVDNKGRIMLPTKLREELNIKAGDVVFLNKEEDGNIILTKAINPLDLIALEGIKEYKEGKSKTLQEIAEKYGVKL